MSLSQCQAFMHYLRDQNLMGQADLEKVLKQFGRIDRKIGQLAALYGILKPESIPQILEAQTRDAEKLFGQCAMQLALMDEEQVTRVLRIQNDDLFLLSQAVVLLKFSPMTAMLKHLSAFRQTRESQGPPTRLDEEAQKEIIARTKKALKGINAIAPLPPTAAKAMSMLNDQNVDIDKLGHVLSMDPSFVGIMLKMVNSAFYGLRTRIISIKNAVVVLGLNKLRQLIIAATVMDKFKNLPEEFSSRFWEHAVWTGEWSKQLGNHFKMEETDELFVAGILHNVGELLSLQYFPAEQAKIDELVAGGRHRLEAEREWLGGTHADIGSYLFSLWDLPAEIVQSTMLHHNDMTLLAAMPNIKPQTLVVNMAVSLSSIDSSLDSFSFQQELVKRFTPFRSLPFQGIGSLKLDPLYERVSAAVTNILSIFQKAR